jgi:hypothetical protein
MRYHTRRRTTIGFCILKICKRGILNQNLSSLVQIRLSSKIACVNTSSSMCERWYGIRKQVMIIREKWRRDLEISKEEKLYGLHYLCTSEEGLKEGYNQILKDSLMLMQDRILFKRLNKE